MAKILTRQAGRVVLVGPDGSVLLLSGTDPDDLAAPPFWFVPGGGAEKDETPEQAARREVYEEVGASLDDLGPPVWRRHTSFAFAGHWYEQDEWFFVVRTRNFQPRATALTALERRATTGARWWTLEELTAVANRPSGTQQGRETVYPPGLAHLVEEWLAHGPPPHPRQIQ